MEVSLQKNTLLEIIKIYIFTNSTYFSWTLSCLLSLILDIISKIQKEKKGKERRIQNNKSERFYLILLENDILT